MELQSYILKRIVGLLPTLVLITLTTFLIIKIAPGDPILMFMDTMEADQADDLERLRERMGLNDPLHIQYWRWMTDFFSGNFGHSIAARRPVLELIIERFPATLLLTMSSLLFSLIVSIPVGVISAVKQYSALDNVVTTVAFFGIAMPNFWLGLLMIWMFSIFLGILPSGGMGTIGVESGWPTIVDTARHLVMPMVVLGTASMAGFTRYMRSSVLEVLREDYIRTARAKGLSERVVLYKHALKNAFIPIATLLGFQLRQFVSGSLITEQIFAWPGLGWYTWHSVNRRDYPVMMGILTFAALLTLVGNLLADISYAFLDPQIRYN